jgi:hypothetical protein
MSILFALYLALLFVLLTPGILVHLPKNGSKWTVAIVHAAVFGLVYFLTNGLVKNMFDIQE